MPTVSSPAELGELIRQERKRQGLTQGELAAYCGVGLNFVSAVERGKETAELGKVLRLVNMLGMDFVVEKRSTWQRISRHIAREGTGCSASASSTV